MAMIIPTRHNQFALLLFFLCIATFANAQSEDVYNLIEKDNKYLEALALIDRDTVSLKSDEEKMDSFLIRQLCLFKMRHIAFDEDSTLSALKNYPITLAYRSLVFALAKTYNLLGESKHLESLIETQLHRSDLIKDSDFVAKMYECQYLIHYRRKNYEDALKYALLSFSIKKNKNTIGFDNVSPSAIVRLYKLVGDTIGLLDFRKQCDSLGIKINDRKIKLDYNSISSPDFNFDRFNFTLSGYFGKRSRRDSLCYLASLPDVMPIDKIRFLQEVEFIDKHKTKYTFFELDSIDVLFKIADNYHALSDFQNEFDYLQRVYCTVMNYSNNSLDEYKKYKVSNRIMQNCIEREKWSDAYNYLHHTLNSFFEIHGISAENIIQITEQPKIPLSLCSDIVISGSRISEFCVIVWNMLYLYRKAADLFCKTGDFKQALYYCDLIEKLSDFCLANNVKNENIKQLKYDAQISLIRAKCNFNLGNLKKSAEYFTDCFEKQKNKYWRDIIAIDTGVFENGRNYYSAYSINEMAMQLRNFDVVQNDIYKYTLPNSKLMSSLSYNYALFSKQLQLETEKIIKEKAHFGAKSSMKIDSLKRALDNESDCFLRDSLRELIEDEERLLLSGIRSYISKGDLSFFCDYDTIQKHLKTTDCAIEFVNYYDSCQYCNYLALILTKDSLPKPVYLCKVSANSSKLPFDSIYTNIEPYLKGVENIYFSPTGLLHQIPLESMQIDSASVMSDKFNMIRLSSTREIMQLNDYSNYEKAAIYGGINYNVTGEELLAESQKYVVPTNLVTRDVEHDTINRGSVNYLIGTKIESEKINALMKEHNVNTNLYSSESANEESFKALSGKHQNIIHIATHGFTWTDSVAQKKEYFYQRLNTMEDDVQLYQYIDPLDRCGLLFAGANIALTGNSIVLPEGVQDGILTAKEILQMDLRGCDLVVLSACETAKGDITSEGVFGLQRAFKMAGVQTIIMSLWKVNDNATQMLMTEFYRNWIEKKQSKREAFKNAQNAVRFAVDEYGDRMYESPEFWAGFIMLD